MKNINKLGMVITKILEVFHWVAVAMLIAATVCCVAKPDWVGYFVEPETTGDIVANLEVYGFEVITPLVNGVVDSTTFLLFGIGSSVIMAVMAMVFRNLNLIFKKSKETTPFCKDNIRMMREIGIFSIAVPVIGLIMSIIIRIVTGVDSAEISVDTNGFFMGIIVLCLTQFFIHGAKLEEDVDGLL